MPLKWQMEKLALLALLDCDRDGHVTEDDLLYWLGYDLEEEVEEEEAARGAAADDGVTWGAAAASPQAPVATPAPQQLATPSMATPQRAAAAEEEIVD